MPLTLAAAAVAAGFLSFLPTDYRGVSELGQIAGVGMLIAYLTSITLLPALLDAVQSAGRAGTDRLSRAGAGRSLPADATAFRSSSERWRSPCSGSPLLYFLTFDFDPIHLRSPKTESIATLLDLGGDPQRRHQFDQRGDALARRGRRGGRRACASCRRSQR